MLYEAKAMRIYNPETKMTYTKSPGDSATPATEGAPADLPPELNDKYSYYIHYKGWKSTWDEWVSDERVLAWNEENLRTQKELKQMALAAASKKKSFINLDIDGPAMMEYGLSSENTAAAMSAAVKRRESGKRESQVGRPPKRSRVYDEMDKVGRFGCCFIVDCANIQQKEDDFIRKQEVSLVVPDQLKALLVDDWEFVTKEHQVIWNSLGCFASTN